MKNNTETVVYVDSKGKPTGETAPKLDAHHANTKLHLAFSCYIFNKQNQLLVTRRALSKKVWPGVWTNSLCGHPLPGEKIDDAIKRRMEYELGITKFGKLRVVLPNYKYQTPPFKGIIENEFCPVYFAYTDQVPSPNDLEVEEYKWIEPKVYVESALGDTENKWSYWCKDQIKKLEEINLL